MKLYIPVGISGSGKSTLKKNLDGTVISVCPDNIRKELTGSINDQTQNARVFEVAFKRTKEYLKADKNVFFDATNLQRKSIDTLIALGKNANADIQIFLLEDSRDVELCRQRVREDIQKGVERSDTSDASKGIQERQAQAYMQIVSYISNLSLKEKFNLTKC